MVKLYLSVLFIAWGSSVKASADCESLIFKDEFLGDLIPCSWDNAKGMLCMKEEEDVVIYPDSTQVEILESCGIELPRTNSSRSKRDIDEFDELVSGPSRFKRAFGVSSAGFRNTGFKYRNMLKNFVRQEWGKSKAEEIEPVARSWIERKLQLDGAKEAGVYRSMVSRSKHLEASGRITKTLRKNLEAQKGKKNWEFLNVELILSELNSCTFMGYSGTSNQDVKFEKPKGSSNETSGVSLWYYRVNCMQRSGRVFFSLVIYSDRLSFSDVSKTVEYWRNNPKTLANFILEAKRTNQLGTVENVGSDTSRSCRGTLCVTKTTYKKIAKLTKFQLVEQIPKIIKRNVDHWVKDTKSIFVKQTLTMDQKRDLEKWMRNAMLAEIFRKFSSFLQD